MDLDVRPVTAWRPPVSYTPPTVFLSLLIAELSMKYWRFAALLALATLPLLLTTKKEKGLRPVSGDLDNIFEYELSVD